LVQNRIKPKILTPIKVGARQKYLKKKKHQEVEVELKKKRKKLRKREILGGGKFVTFYHFIKNNYNIKNYI
jgi:hypothetical protein